ncbi:MAG: YggT family protein [Actinobacteria bacterium]|nr:YggT family protein [Actinomycetota bacterium]
MLMIESILLSLLRLFFYTLIIRFILDWVQVLSRNWRPQGPVLVIAEIVYSITDPPLNFIRRFIRPIRMGTIQLDLAFIVLFFGVQFLMNLVRVLL